MSWISATTSATVGITSGNRYRGLDRLGALELGVPGLVHYFAAHRAFDSVLRNDLRAERASGTRVDERCQPVAFQVQESGRIFHPLRNLDDRRLVVAPAAVEFVSLFHH